MPTKWSFLCSCHVIRLKRKNTTEISKQRTTKKQRQTHFLSISSFSSKTFQTQNRIKPTSQLQTPKNSVPSHNPQLIDRTFHTPKLPWIEAHVQKPKRREKRYKKTRGSNEDNVPCGVRYLLGVGHLGVIHKEPIGDGIVRSHGATKHPQMPVMTR